MRLDVYARQNGIQLPPVWTTPDIVDIVECPYEPVQNKKYEEVVGYVPDFAHALPGSRYDPSTTGR